MSTCSLNRNDTAFDKIYGEMQGITALVRAIRCNKAERGEIRRRCSKNGIPKQSRTEGDGTDSEDG